MISFYCFIVFILCMCVFVRMTFSFFDENKKIHMTVKKRVS